MGPIICFSHTLSTLIERQYLTEALQMKGALPALRTLQINLDDSERWYKLL
jgi:hypothetical protein